MAQDYPRTELTAQEQIRMKAVELSLKYYEDRVPRNSESETPTAQVNHVVQVAQRFEAYIKADV